MGPFCRPGHRSDHRYLADLAVGFDTAGHEGLDEATETLLLSGAVPGAVASRPAGDHHVKPARFPGGEPPQLLEERFVVAVGGGEYQVSSHASLLGGMRRA